MGSEMVDKKLDAYKGRLTPEQIAAGMNAAQRNAKRLLDDALLLLESRRFPSAASLATLSIEESGKVSILRGLALAKNDKEVSQYWRDYRSHTRKNVAWIFLDLVAQGARSLDAFKPIFDPASDHPFVLDELKQIGFYSDCLGNVHWSVPEEVIDESLAEALVRTAQILGRGQETTREEIEVWIKHMGPVWNTSPAWMKRALVNWHREARERGLITGDQDAMEKFVGNGLNENDGTGSS